MPAKKPHANTPLADFIEKRVLAMRPKQQNEIAEEAGFKNVNMLSMIKSGTSKLPIDRVAALAKALDCDPKLLFRLAFEQQGQETTALTIAEIFGAIVTRNEAIWLHEIRDASGNSDPGMTTRSRAALRAIFGK
jgi:transcriptional regulator with XRE-family HTH domain